MNVLGKNQGEIFKLMLMFLDWEQRGAILREGAFVTIEMRM